MKSVILAVRPFLLSKVMALLILVLLRRRFPSTSAMDLTGFLGPSAEAILPSAGTIATSAAAAGCGAPLRGFAWSFVMAAPPDWTLLR